MKKLIAIFILIIMIAGLFSGCGQSAVNNGNQSAVDTGSAAAESQAAVTTQNADTVNKSTVAESTGGSNAANAYPLTVTDANGYKLTLEKEPVRIASLTLGSDEMLLGLIDKSRVSALSIYSDDPGLSNVAEEAKSIPGRVSLSKIENIITLKPDLLFTDTWTDPKEVKQLRDAGIPVYVFKDPNNIDEQKKTVLELAHVVGADSKGSEIVAWMDQNLQSVADKLKNLSDDKKLTVMDYGEMGSSGQGTNFDDIVTRAGLINVVARAGYKGWPTISKEKIVELNPDIIILPSWYYNKKNTLQGMINTLKSDKSLANVAAVKNNRLISVPNPHISAISQYVVLAVGDVAKAAYPDLFK